MARGRTSPPNSAIAGSVALEYGLLVPALIFLILGAMDAGRLIWTYTTLHRAVEASARCAAINASLCGTAPQIASRAADEAWGLAVTPATFTVQTQSCGAQVTANYPFSLLVPWLGDPQQEAPPSTIMLTVSACYPL